MSKGLDQAIKLKRFLGFNIRQDPENNIKSFEASHKHEELLTEEEILWM